MKKAQPSKLPLEGVKVVDFGQYIAGPAAAMTLADLGATVVHIDPPGGPMWDSPANAILNRNKLSLELDLKSSNGLRQAKDLVAEADIVIENFRPGVMKRLGLDLAQARQERPKLITVSIPGFASDDEERRELRAFEGVVAASSGMYTDMGLNRVLMGINPSYSPLPLASAYGTMIASSAAVLALQSRERTGLGDHIEVPLSAAIMEGLCYNSITIDDMPERYKTHRNHEIDRRIVDGLPMNLDYDGVSQLLDPFYRNYKCKDGRMFYVVCPGHKNHARKCLQALGLLEDLIAEGLVEQADSYEPTSEWTSDVSLGVYPLPSHWAEIISARMQEVFLTRTSSEWQKIFGEGRFPGAPQRWLQEWIHDEHARAAGLMIDVDDEEFGKMSQPGPLVWMEESGERALKPSPRRHVDYDTAIKALRSLPTDIPKPCKKDDTTGWLKGVRVLDLCNVIAGPHSAAFLVRFGAEVIKLDPAEPMYDAWYQVIFGMTHMRGKRSVLTDVRSPEGQAVLARLVKSVDIVVWNATEKQAKDLGLDIDGLRKLNPNAIFCRLDCFSGVQRGPRSDYRGYDDLVQAGTGIMLRFGGSMDTPEEHAHLGTIDVMCGFGGSLGMAAALYQREKTGVAGRPCTSLSALSGLAQLPFCFDFEGRGLFDEASGREATGIDELTRFYHTSSDRCVLLSCYESDVERLDTIEGLEGIASVPKDQRAEFLAHAFLKARAREWVERLTTADVGVAVCENIETLRAYNSREADDRPGIDQGSYSFSIFSDHPCGHTVTQLDHYAVRSSRGEIVSPTPAEKYGASTRAVLSELGYGQAEVDALIKTGVASESWSKEYLPS